MIKENKDTIMFLIHKENEGNRIINSVMPELIDVFKPYINKKIQKKDFSILKEIENKLKPIFDKYKNSDIKSFGDKEGHIHYLYLKSSEYNLYLNMSICWTFPKKDYCGSDYSEGHNYFLNVRDGILNSIDNKEKMIYTKEDLNQFEKCFKLKEELNAEMNKIKLHSIRELLG